MVDCQEKNEIFLHRVRFLGEIYETIDVAPLNER